MSAHIVRLISSPYKPWTKEVPGTLGSGPLPTRLAPETGGPCASTAADEIEAAESAVELGEPTPRGCVGQRAFHRSQAETRVIVAGRQSGKTHSAAEEVVRIILSRPGSESCLLMPTYKSTKGALRHLRRALLPLGNRVVWKSVDKEFHFPNGAILYVRTADDKTGVPVRGLTLDGVLWVDEATFVPRSAWEAAEATQAAVADPRRIVTCTARGRKSWVYDLARDSLTDPDVAFFRYRTTDSPFHNPDFVRNLRKRYGAARANEELDGLFLAEGDLPFHPDDLEVLFSDQKIKRRGEDLFLGIDLAKHQDWCFLFLMNEFGEGWCVGRWQKVKWPETHRRIGEIVRTTGAICVVDTGGVGGGVGETLADWLEDKQDGLGLPEDRVIRVRTNVWSTKGKLIEQLRSDVEHGRLRVQAGDEGAQILRHELTFFPAPERSQIGGQEIFRYKGAPDDDDELFDDGVTAFYLANFGRVHCLAEDPLGGTFSTGFGAVKTSGDARQSTPLPDLGDYGGFGAVKSSGRTSNLGGFGSVR